MIVAKSINKTRKIIYKAKKLGKLIGFVPTMGALHNGHLSLVKRAKKECNFVVVSIFVNPIQFGPKEDYKKYPRRFKEDVELLKKERVDLIFFPSVEEMYQKNFSTFVEETDLSRFLCGAKRPGHFKGVCTVVAKLFNIVQPDIAYFGQKDYQQALIIKRMIRDLNFPIKIKVLPIVREKNGLAMSSRNAYLNKEEREESTCLYRALKLAKEIILKGKRDPKIIIEKMKDLILSNKNVKIDYIKIVDPYTLEDVEVIKKKVLVALAIFIGTTRLIDNFLINLSYEKNK